MRLWSCRAVLSYALLTGLSSASRVSCGAVKRADYFACGTLVVWNVDLLSEEVIKSYKASDPEHPAIFRRGDMAEAEPAVPGWHMAVNALFE